MSCSAQPGAPQSPVTNWGRINTWTVCTFLFIQLVLMVLMYRYILSLLFDRLNPERYTLGLDTLPSKPAACSSQPTMTPSTATSTSISAAPIPSAVPYRYPLPLHLPLLYLLWSKLFHKSRRTWAGQVPSPSCGGTSRLSSSSGLCLYLRRMRLGRAGHRLNLLH